MNQKHQFFFVKGNGYSYGRPGYLDEQPPPYPGDRGPSSAGGYANGYGQSGYGPPDLVYQGHSGGGIRPPLDGRPPVGGHLIPPIVGIPPTGGPPLIGGPPGGKSHIQRLFNTM